MKKLSLKDIGINICTSYTVISIGVHICEIVMGIGDLKQHMNGIVMFLCTTVAVLCLSLYHILEDWSPALIIIVQYVLAVVAVMGITYLVGCFSEISPEGYFDMWRSFTVIYVLGAIWYYVEIWIYVKKQNRWLEEAKVRQLQVESGKENDLES